MDGYHHRAKQLLEECAWHLRNASASEAMPVHWDAHRFGVLKRLELLVREFEAEEREMERALDEQQ